MAITLEPGGTHYFWAGMKKHFKITNAGAFMSRMHIIIYKQAKIDLLEFDDWLHKHHGPYEDDQGLSMCQLIGKEYGGEAVGFINSVM